MRKLPRNNVRLEKKKERAPQDLISVKFSSFIFCHNVRGETLFHCEFFYDNASPILVSVLYIPIRYSKSNNHQPQIKENDKQQIAY